MIYEDQVSQRSRMQILAQPQDIQIIILRKKNNTVNNYFDKAYHKVYSTFNVYIYQRTGTIPKYGAKYCTFVGSFILSRQLIRHPTAFYDTFF